MGIVSFIILKLFYGAERFESEPLDKLAEVMSVKSALKGKLPRYYKAKANQSCCSALYDGSIIFDKKYYDMLTQDEVLAVGAHEFNHLIQKHVRKKLLRLVVPSLIISLVFAVLAGASQYLVGAHYYYGALSFAISLGLVFVFPFMVFLFASLYVNASWLRNQEIECDLRTVEFKNGEAMISALNKIRVRFPRSQLDIRLSKLFPRTYPTLEKRKENILKAMNGPER